MIRPVERFAVNLTDTPPLDSRSAAAGLGRTVIVFILCGVATAILLSEPTIQPVILGFVGLAQ